MAHEGASDVDGTDSQRVPILEAVKTGILGSLGLDKEPRPAHKASEQELRKMYRLYREKLREMRGNSSQPMRETWQTTMSTVLFPATGEILVREGGTMQILRPNLVIVTLTGLI